MDSGITVITIHTFVKSITIYIHAVLINIGVTVVINVIAGGTLPSPLPARLMVERINQFTKRQSLHIGDGESSVQRVAWCTGAAQNYLDAAVVAGADMFVTGEISEQSVHIAREEGIHFVSAGHHATERYGVQAVGEHLAEKFGLEHHFIDIDNPV